MYFPYYNNVTCLRGLYRGVLTFVSHYFEMNLNSVGRGSIKYVGHNITIFYRVAFKLGPRTRDVVEIIFIRLFGNVCKFVFCIAS